MNWMDVEGDPEVQWEGKWIRIWQHPCGWEYVERVATGSAVVIVAATADGQAILVEQPRIPTGGRCIEWPAGLIGDLVGHEKEGPEVAAIRELEEEAGYRPGKVTTLVEGPPSPGMSSEWIYMVLAENLEKVSDGGGDESEFITVHHAPLATIDQWLAGKEAEGLIVDPKVYSGLYFLRTKCPEMFG